MMGMAEQPGRRLPLADFGAQVRREGRRQFVATEVRIDAVQDGSVVRDDDDGRLIAFGGTDRPNPARQALAACFMQSACVGGQEMGHF